MSHVTLLPVHLNSLVNVWTMPAATPTFRFPDRTSVASFAKYGEALKGYFVCASHTQNISMSYLSGLLDKLAFTL